MGEEAVASWLMGKVLMVETMLERDMGVQVAILMGEQGLVILV